MNFLIPKPKRLQPRDWKESWVDQMGLIVALSGEQRFKRLEAFKLEMMAELKDCLRQRFTPSNGEDGCQSATEAVKEAIA